MKTTIVCFATLLWAAASAFAEGDTAKAVAFAMSIAQEMKRSAKNEDEKRNVSEIHLSRRPTTRAQTT